MEILDQKPAAPKEPKPVRKELGARTMGGLRAQLLVEHAQVHMYRVELPTSQALDLVTACVTNRWQFEAKPVNKTKWYVWVEARHEAMTRADLAVEQAG